MTKPDSNLDQRKITGKRKNHSKSLFVAAVLTAGSSIAIAENNVQIFGIIDTGILTQSKSTDAAGRDVGRQTQMATSGLRQSVWGFKGKENLGKDLNAFFNLESHFDTNNGNIHGTGDPDQGTVLFRRQANVGLSGSWGTLILGRQYGPALLAHIDTEPRAFKEQFSNLYAWAYGQINTHPGVMPLERARNSNNDVGIFFSNAVQYRNTVGPVAFGILYSLGGAPGDTKKNSAWALGASYSGPVTLSGSYQGVKDKVTGVTDIKHYGLGIKFPVSTVLAIKANYLEAKNYDGVTARETAKIQGASFGLDYKWHPANTATIAYYDNKDKINPLDQTHNVVLSNDYSLSKRTTLYAQMAYVDAKAGATIRTSIVAAGVPAQGEKTMLLNAGINHTF